MAQRVHQAALRLPVQTDSRQPPQDPHSPRPSPVQPGADEVLQKRLLRIEETAGFADHRTEQLTREVREMNTLLVELLQRLERLERRIDRLAADHNSGSATEADPGNAENGDGELA